MPQLRIHFTDLDLARTRLKLEMDLMWEIVSSVQLLQHAEEGACFDPWRRRIRDRVSRDRVLRSAVRTLMTVAPHATYFPDFLTPALDTTDIDVAVDAVLSVPSGRRAHEVSRLRPADGAAANWLNELAAGKVPALRHLRQALRVYFRSVIEPKLQTIDGGLQKEWADGAQRYLKAGPEGLLRWFSPAATWEPPILTIDYPFDRDLHLGGRGLVLAPCYFCVHHPVALADPRLRPILVFPIAAGTRLLAAGHGDGGNLSALLGATRATILRAVVSGCSTTGLSKLVGVAPATISHHTGVLRAAGLVTTHRHERAATHTITPLGLRVLTSSPVDAEKPVPPLRG
ncbi:winged helix-turn-helix domain-containing protein [Amycolatopsis sp.]|uniref:ArsR/SmtB family transcription factor n=1 Tax=Amycolatopsis sp. TaxID=37632 RepID=UPI002D7E585B|nr:winged helix-turn-helix domain-containing protein [Amycolatopsis sp.]HET6707094.1 winged helix-turn-helix domain-containing protein [Amycolatopsis sp.]